jgi:hypothetical protein
MAEATVNQRSNGQFAKGNKVGNRFKEGNNANPNGRNGSMSDLFKELAKAEDSKGKTRKEKILNKVLSMAENGSLKAAEMYMNRVEGKPREYVEQRIRKDEIIIE